MPILPKSFPKFIPFSFVVLILLAFISIIAINFNTIKHYNFLKQEKEKQKEIVMDLDRKVQDKRNLKEKYLTDKRQNETAARDEYKMRKPKEKTIYVNEGQTSGTLKKKY
jgi:hypothetical protein